MMVGMTDVGDAADHVTQEWVRRTGRKISFAAYPWLIGPISEPNESEDAWLRREAVRLGGDLVGGGGLLGRMSDLAGDDFDPARLTKPIAEFYEQTSDWRMEVWSQWSAAAWPFGWLLSSVFSRRLGQLNLPLRPLDTAHGMDSRIVVVQDQHGSQVGAAWLRTLRATGETIYSGWYGTATLPAAHRPSLRVVFPLPKGNLTVFLRPEIRPDGALVLASPIGPFGTDGAYLVVAHPDRQSGWVRRIPLAEEFVVSVDDEGTLRTDHTLKLWRIPVFELHYRMAKV
jgi:hypothetical protein